MLMLYIQRVLQGNPPSLQADSLALCPLGSVFILFSLVHLKTSGEDTLPLNSCSSAMSQTGSKSALQGGQCSCALHVQFYKH